MQASKRESAPPYYRPYRWAAVDFQLGLRPINPNCWILMEAEYAANMNEKCERLVAYPQQYYRALPSSLGAQRELQERVITHLLRDYPERFVRVDSVIKSLDTGVEIDSSNQTVEPLLQLSKLIEEDFMLIEEVDGRSCITAASNVYSSSGRLVASVGRAVAWAHEPVPRLTDTLGRRIDQIIGSIHAATPCERFNWQITPLSSIFFPRDNPHAENAAAMHGIYESLRANPAAVGDMLWIRVERQTLSRLPDSGAVAFSLHTFSDPLSSIQSDLQSVRAVLALLRGYSVERLKYSEMDIIREPLIAWFESIARQSQ
jgi:dimethylamine monooxygenase subunit A